MRDEKVLKTFAQWESEKPMSKMLPIQFADGTRLDHLEIGCGGCASILRPQDQRGVVSMAAADTFRLNGLAACEKCRSFTRYSLLCSGSGGVVTVEWNATGKVKRLQVRATWLTRLIAWLSGRT